MIKSAMTLPDVLSHYEGRVRELQAGMFNARWHSNVAAVVMAVAVAAFFMLGFYAFRHRISFLWLALPLPLAVISALRYRLIRDSGYRMSRLRSFYERAVQRVQGEWVGTGVTGEEFTAPDHVYATDLNILGRGSLFELLCIARTSIGQRGLATFLLETPSLQETLFRQDAVRELQTRVDLREQVASLGKFEFLESKSSTFETWLLSPTLSYSQTLRTLILITSTLLAAMVIAGLLGLIPWINVAICISPLIVFHSCVGLIFRNRVNKMQEWCLPISVETQVLREGLRLLGRGQFQSPKLGQLSEQVGNASHAVHKLERLLSALNERNKEWFYGPSLLLMVGTQMCMAVEQWRKEHELSLRVWLQAWAEFEALNALAAYAYENPANTFPEFASGEVCFEARALGHPLLSHSSCIVNDVTLNQTNRFYVVSGSNMSGKSTLLRAIGINAVLAFAGSPVQASALRMSRLSVFASISIVDSLLNGTSRFLAEMERLRRTIESASKMPVLFLVDEIFSGTNSRDRRIATEAVVRTLVERGAIGALSTHDLLICEIGCSETLHGTNVHMGAREGGGPLDFDYRLKQGVKEEANALAIARMAGVPV